MAEFGFGTGGAAARELLIAYLNVGTAAEPVWAPLGRRVTDSSERFDWEEESGQDILGGVYTSMKKPIISQSFEAWELTGGDAAQEKIYNLAVVEQDAPALSSQDMLIAHFYTGTGGSGGFAERYSACAVRPEGIGGEGGGSLVMDVRVTYGGTRTVGTVSRADGTVCFTPAVSTGGIEDGGDPL